MNADFVRGALDRFERPLLDYAKRVTGDLDAARDVVQETFVRLWSEDQAAVQDRLAPWLYTVCRRLAVDHQRRERAMKAREQATVATLPSDSPGDAAEQRDELQIMRRLAGLLPEKQQEALRLRFQGGLSYQEIASVMEESIGHVGWLLHQGLKDLRQRMEAREVQG